MQPTTRSLLKSIAVLAIIASGFFLLTYKTHLPPPTSPHDILPVAITTPVENATTSSANPIKSTSTALLPETSSEKPVTSEVTRIENPYPFAPIPTAVLVGHTQSAIVNILCISSGPSFRSISGSGVIVNPLGVVLTNAHVAQYVLLSSHPKSGLSCTIRAGSPASERWIAQVAYIPSIWVTLHAHEINTEKPPGTGEHDYALLLITQSTNGSPLPVFPFVPIDTREAVAFPGDAVLVASYPAEFLGGSSAQFNLHPMSSLTSVGPLLTFETNTSDILSLGGVPEAQSGSSGGAIVNMWGHLVGLITATSEGNTTAARDLRAITLSHIDRSLVAQKHVHLPALLAGDIIAQSQDFNANVAPQLVAVYLKYFVQ